MSELDRVKAVREFLLARFQDSTVEECFDGELKAHSFRISARGKTYLAVVRQDFLSSLEPSQVASRLSDFLLFEHLIELPDTPVLVTNSGLKLEYE